MPEVLATVARARDCGRIPLAERASAFLPSDQEERTAWALRDGGEGQRGVEQEKDEIRPIQASIKIQNP